MLTSRLKHLSKRLDELYAECETWLSIKTLCDYRYGAIEERWESFL